MLTNSAALAILPILVVWHPGIAAEGQNETAGFPSYGGPAVLTEIMHVEDGKITIEWRDETEVVPVEDCGNADYMCLKSTFWAFALPRKCESMALNDTWSHAGITTEVLEVVSNRDAQPYTHLQQEPPRTVFLGSASHPHSLMAYDTRRGAMAYLLYSTDIDFYTMAKNQTVSDWYVDEKMARVNSEYFYTSGNTIAQCRTAPATE